VTSSTIKTISNLLGNINIPNLHNSNISNLLDNSKISNLLAYRNFCSEGTIPSSRHADPPPPLSEIAIFA